MEHHDVCLGLLQLTRVTPVLRTPSDKGIKPHVVLECRDERTYLSPYSMAILIEEVVLWCLMGLFGPVGLTWLLEDKKDELFTLILY